jgi:hypothetical protein
MDFHNAATLGTYLSKSYAREFLTLLVTYKDVSASEAASRLNLHIQTAQDFLESLASLGILSKVEALEKKRPYFRYMLESAHIQMELDLTTLMRARPISMLPRRIRERGDADARFSKARNENAITSIVIWTGEGRDLKERKINLTPSQGKFFYHLPFPNAEPMSVQDLMRMARLEEALAPEIVDMVTVLQDLGVIEMM